MINGINNNDDLVKSRLNGQNDVGNVVTNPISANQENVQNAKYNFNDINDISRDAYYLYQREKDISNYSKMVLEDLDKDTSYNEQVESLLAQGVIDPFIIDDIENLSKDLLDNKRFLKDLDIL
ncbi:hypothetical protein IJG72_03395 [bacterium]|nr:hypothetical protein [bacterium]